MKNNLKYYYSAKWEIILFVVGLLAIGFSLFLLLRMINDDSKIIISEVLIFTILVSIGGIIIGLILSVSFLLKVKQGKMLAMVIGAKGIKIFAREDWTGRVVFEEFIKWEDVKSMDVGKDYHTTGIDNTHLMERDILDKIVFRVKAGTLRNVDNDNSSSFIPFVRANGERESIPGKTITMYKHDDDHKYDEITINVVLNKTKKNICEEIKNFLSDNINKQRLQKEFKATLQARCKSRSADYFLK